MKTGHLGGSARPVPEGHQNNRPMQARNVWVGVREKLIPVSGCGGGVSGRLTVPRTWE